MMWCICSTQTYVGIRSTTFFTQHFESYFGIHKFLNLHIICRARDIENECHLSSVNQKCLQYIEICTWCFTFIKINGNFQHPYTHNRPSSIQSYSGKCSLNSRLVEGNGNVYKFSHKRFSVKLWNFLQEKIDFQGLHFVLCMGKIAQYCSSVDIYRIEWEFKR